MTSLLEHWKPIVGWERYYAISNVGRVRRVELYRNFNPDGLIRTFFDGDGYLLVTLYSIELLGHHQGVGHPVAHLVAATFIGPRPCDLVVNHINGVKTRNWASNLEYITG